MRDSNFAAFKILQPQLLKIAIVTYIIDKKYWKKGPITPNIVY